MKMAPVVKALKKYNFKIIVVHTQQHYDKYMSKQIIRDLEFPDPDYSLGIMGGSHAYQTGKIMISFEEICLKINPNLVVVAGDVNSTIACALVATKLNIKIAHVESGLRSNDREMPEEINRIATDHISDILFTTEESANLNLQKEGVDQDKIYFVGNSMIDSLIKFLPEAKNRKPWIKYRYEKNNYNIVTMHRPSNVDDEKMLKKLCQMINEISEIAPTIFPIHPRTLNKVEESKIIFSKNVKIVKPLSYIEFLGLMSEAFMIITDSGGIQEETTSLGVKCITIRNNTERPVTTQIGTNYLAGTNPSDVISLYKKIYFKYF